MLTYSTRITSIAETCWKRINYLLIVHFVTVVKTKTTLSDELRTCTSPVVLGVEFLLLVRETRVQLLFDSCLAGRWCPSNLQCSSPSSTRWRWSLLPGVWRWSRVSASPFLFSFRDKVRNLPPGPLQSGDGVWGASKHGECSEGDLAPTACPDFSLLCLQNDWVCVALSIHATRLLRSGSGPSVVSPHSDVSIDCP